MKPAVEPATLAAKRLKQRIECDLFPCLVEELLHQAGHEVMRQAASSDALLAVQQQARTLLLRWLIVSFAAARPMPGNIGKAAAWRQIRQWAASHTEKRNYADPLWRQRIDRLLHDYYRASGRAAEPLPKISAATWARIVDRLARDDQNDPCQSQWLDYGAFDLRLLGEAYEGLLAVTVDEQTGRPIRSTQGRKASGSFYTSREIVDYIVARTLDPLLVRPADTLRVLDPAMGCGYFLLAAVRRIAARLQSTCTALDASQLRRLWQTAARSLYGLDIDPLAVELAQASVWLECRLDRCGMLALRRRLRCGNALLDERFDGGRESGDRFPSQFDAVVGNPPFGAKLSAAERSRACKLLPQMRHNGDTAVGFLERSHRWLAPHGRCGLIVPKALTYSFSWRPMREHLAGRVVELVDVSEVWAEVRLEQVILLSAAGERAAAYQSRVWRGDALSSPVEVPWRLAERLEAWPCGLDRSQQRFVRVLSRRTTAVGHLCRTFRGLPLQAKLAPAGKMAVLAGRDLMRWHVRSIHGFMDDNLPSARFAGERLLFQNIIAHVVRPRPHLRLIGCHDASGRATLDTVNNLVARRGDVDLHGVLGLLHTDFVNWYVYTVIYNQAVRTMHFDQYFLNKIPLPRDWQRLLGDLSPLSQAMERSLARQRAAEETLADRDITWLDEDRRQIENQMNDLVNRAYGWRGAAT
jgi:hypothetical protein